jgi:peroxiredoxin
MAISFGDDFTLPTQDDEPFRLADTLREAAATVLLPYRGHW